MKRKIPCNKKLTCPDVFKFSSNSRNNGIVTKTLIKVVEKIIL